MTHKMSKSTYSLTMTAAFIGMGLLATQAMAAQDAAPPVQEPVATAAPMQEASPPAPGSFEALDVNADGNLAKEEIPADHALAKGFKKADTDKNGALNKAEFEAHQAKKTK